MKTTNRWISVNERLPPSNVLVLWLPGCEDEHTARYFDDGQWRAARGYRIEDITVTHWQPFPELPKSDGPFYIDTSSVGYSIMVDRTVPDSSSIPGYLMPSTDIRYAQLLRDWLNGIWQRYEESDDDKKAYSVC